MSIAHRFMSILIHRAGFMSIAHYEFYDNIGSMYELCSYYDNGFIMDELSSYISCMTFIMIPNRYRLHCYIRLIQIHFQIQMDHGFINLMQEPY